MLIPPRLGLRLLILSALSFAANAVVAGPPPAPAEAWKGTGEEKLWGLMTVYSQVEYVFPHFDRQPDLDWDAEVQAAIPKVLAASDLDSYYGVLMELVAKLGDSHTMVLPPWGYLKPGHDLAPIEVRIDNGRFHVARVGERPHLAEQGILPGVEILAIDGVEAQTHFEETVLRYYSKGPRHANEATLAVYLLYGPGGESTTLRFRDRDGAVREASVVRDALSGTPVFMTQLLANAFAGPTIRTDMLESDIQYVAIPNFEHEQARQDFLDRIDGMDAERVSGMIIDLRDNMGGSSAISEPMVSCLIDEMVVSPTMKFRHYVGAHEAWGNDPIWETTHHEIDPRDGKRYLGPIIVLVNGATNGSAEDFAIELRTAGRAQLVGQRTAGGAGNALTSCLPGGGTLRVATFTALTPEGEEYVGVGIAPDLEVPVRPEDLAAGRDPVLERALQLFEGQ